jgi:hypothetical protein
MRLNDFIEGLTTLRPYYDDLDRHHVGAEHDRIFAYATDRPLPRPDFVKMLGLGWFQTTVGGSRTLPPMSRPLGGVASRKHARGHTASPSV